MDQGTTRKQALSAILTFSIIFLTNLYKNDITSGLIYKPPKEPFAKIADFIEAGYSV
jgi:hypothetical protein